MKEPSQKVNFSIDNSGFFLPSGFWILTSDFSIIQHCPFK
jgi:hypothetical protein